MDEFTRAWIARACDDVLRRSGALDVLPTPVEAVLELLGARPRVLTDVPDALRSRLLGAVWFDERAVFVEGRQSPARRRFTEAHEATHLLCPWHEAALRSDTAMELFGSAGGLEAEANFGASRLIFQGTRFRDEAAGEPRSLETACALAAVYGASRLAAAHHYVETHAGDAALLIAGRWPSGGRLPVWRTVESATFAAAHGSLGGLRTLGGEALMEAVEAARRTSGPVETLVRGFRAEVVNNRHCHLVLLAPVRARLAA